MANSRSRATQKSKGKTSRPRISASGSTFATVIVGKNKETFVVHEHPLIHYSKFFNNALTGGFKEAKEKTLRLEEANAETFELFVHWLYVQRFPDEALDNEDLVNIWKTNHQKWNPHIDLYIFADVYLVDKLRSDTIKHIFNFCKIGHVLCPVDVSVAFETHPADSPLCRLMVDVFGILWARNDIAYEDYNCVRFLQGVCRLQARIFKGTDDGELSPDFRIHVSNYCDQSAE